MALNQAIKNGVVFIPGTGADIEADRLAVKLVVGRLYLNTDNNNIGRAVSNGNTTTPTLTDVITWDVTSTWVMGQITDAVAAEATLRTQGDSDVTQAFQAADAILQTAIDAVDAAIDAEVIRATAKENLIQGYLDTEVSDRQSADLVLQGNIDAEILRATTREDEIEAGYEAADAALETTLTAAFQATLDAYADKDVRSVIKAAYTDGGTLSIATLLGASPVDGVHAIFCTSTAIGNTATMTSPVALATGEEVVDFGDQYHVTVDGGVVTAVVKVDSILKSKFDSLDSSITTLNEATTASAIRAHFTQAGWVTITNGEVKVEKSAQSGNDILNGTDGFAYLSVQGTSIRYTVDGNLVDGTVSNTVTDIYAQLADVSANLVQADNGLSIEAGKVGLGGVLRKNATITGAYAVDMSATEVVKLPYSVYDCFTATRNASGYVTGMGAKTAGKVHVWFDENGDPINLFVPN